MTDNCYGLHKIFQLKFVLKLQLIEFDIVISECRSDSPFLLSKLETFMQILRLLRTRS